MFTAVRVESPSRDSRGIHERRARQATCGAPDLLLVQHIMRSDELARWVERIATAHTGAELAALSDELLSHPVTSETRMLQRTIGEFIFRRELQASKPEDPTGHKLGEGA